MRLERILTAAVLFILVGCTTSNGQDHSEVQIKSKYLQGQVYLLKGAGGNIGASVGPDGILIVDDQFAPLSEKIKAALEKLGTGPIKFILNTHWHGDHTGGNRNFGKSGTIIAHTNVRRRLSTKQFSSFFKKELPAHPKEAWPVITFDESVSLHFNDEEIEVIHFPSGHTDGDSVVFFSGSNVVHLGDHFFNGGFPFVDLSSGGDVEGYIRNVRSVLNRLKDDTVVVPGHGPVASKKDLAVFLTMLTETSQIVRQKIAEGKDLDSITQEGLPQHWASWGVWFYLREKMDPHCL